MKKVLEFKNCILLIIAIVIVAGGFYFDVRETRNLFDDLSYSSAAGSFSDNNGKTSEGSGCIKAAASITAAVAEIRNTGVIREAARRMENRANGRRILVITLILFLCLSFGSFFLNVLPSVFPWTDIISSRRSIIGYIHMQDGQK